MHVSPPGLSILQTSSRQDSTCRVHAHVKYMQHMLMLIRLTVVDFVIAEKLSTHRLAFRNPVLNIDKSTTPYIQSTTKRENNNYSQEDVILKSNEQKEEAKGQKAICEQVQTRRYSKAPSSIQHVHPYYKFACMYMHIMFMQSRRLHRVS